MTFRFTLSHAVLGSLVISEPDGFEGAKIKLERHPDFFSLIEYYEGAANSAFIFYGRNDAEGIDGGIEFIRQIETTYGFDANITFLVEYAPEDITFSTVFSGMLDISQKTEMKDNRMQVPVIRDDFWSRLINRFDTPVSLSSLVSLDGAAVSPVEPIDVNLTPQIIREKYQAEVGLREIVGFTSIADNSYLLIGHDEIILDEIEEVFTQIPTIDSAELPSDNMTPVYAGTYRFQINVITYVLRTVTSPSLEFHFQSVKTFGLDYIDYYLNIDGTEYLLSWADVTIPPGVPALPSGAFQGGDITKFTYDAVHSINAKSSIKFYGKMKEAWVHPGGADDYVFIHNTYVTTSLTTTDKSNILITADTIYPATQAPGYLIHDAIYGVLERIVGPDSFYSEFLGGLLTNMRQYDEDGCGWMYVLLKGIHIRGYHLSDELNDATERYTLQQRSFFISMKDIWEGINPILNLGLGYEIVDSVQVIRIEQKGHFIGDTPPVNFSNVREISASYDHEYIFKTVKTGYNEWQAEQASGLDDPQTKHTRALRFEKVGKELNLYSTFIAAGLCIEQTRRTSVLKSADYKYDDKNFIISLNTDDVSPDVYTPELDENFASVSNLLNSSTRYNLILTPLRNLLRWRNYLSGCLQSYLSSTFKFVSGEGNYDMITDANTDLLCPRAVNFTSLAESADVAPDGVNYLFLPILYDISIPMEKEEFDLIDRKQPIGISQTDSGHAEFHIKELEYEIIKGEAVIKAWPKVFFDITVVDQEITNPVCE